MKFKDISSKSETELRTLLKEAEGKLTQLRFQVGENKLKKVDLIGKARKEIARVKTALKQISK